MGSPLVRQANDATNPLHSLVYFAPEAERRMTGLGLRAGRMCYFAGRAAPLGPVGPGRGHGHVLQLQPGAGGALHPGGLGDHHPGGGTRRALRGRRRGPAPPARPRDRGLGRRHPAGRAGPRGGQRLPPRGPACSTRPTPTWTGLREPLVAMWHAISLLREHRGDGHLAALTAAGLTGIEALITHTATGDGLRARVRHGQPGLDSRRLGCGGGRAGRNAACWPPTGR